ncbi:MAG: hypothetical protein JKY65_16205, partial [Planctomycetes bacterium]|nr:hypothetical protein [Planctomycetota bacterium]
MTQPRRLRKDQTHTVCRRTTGRIFFLKPTPKTNQVLEYALVLACSRFARIRSRSARRVLTDYADWLEERSLAPSTIELRVSTTITLFGY